MKWFILLSTGIILSAPAAKAQQPDAALLFVHYKFSQLRDTTDRQHLYTENMVLVVGNHAGLYKSFDRQLSEALDKKKMQEAIANSAGGQVRINRNITGSGTQYFQYPNEKKMVRKENLLGSFLITEALPVIDWHITADTTTFGDLHCQKATGHLKGRDYTAWFCPDLPLHIGPWELNGLPGVIVEAFDAKKEVQFLFDGVEKATALAKSDDPSAANPPGNQGGLPTLPGMEDSNNDPNLIKIPEDATKTTDKEFAKLQEAFRKDPNAFAQSMMAARNSGMPGGNSDKMKMDIKAAPVPVNNNPIELPEKQ